MKKKPTPKNQNAFAKATSIFREQGGVLRTMEAVRLGVHPRTLYVMRDAGVLERLGRGVYRLADLPSLGSPDLVTVREYGAAKTVADCFKYRNKLGLDTAIESLKLFLKKKRGSLDDLVRFARVCRVEKVMRPYIEALL